MEDRGRGQVDTHPGLWPPSPSMSFKSCFEGKEIMDQWMPKIQEIFLSYKEASMKVCLLGAGDVGEPVGGWGCGGGREGPSTEA